MFPAKELAPGSRLVCSWCKELDPGHTVACQDRHNDDPRYLRQRLYELQDEGARFYAKWRIADQTINEMMATALGRRPPKRPPDGLDMALLGIVGVVALLAALVLGR